MPTDLPEKPAQLVRRERVLKTVHSALAAFAFALFIWNVVVFEMRIMPPAYHPSPYPDGYNRLDLAKRSGP